MAKPFRSTAFLMMLPGLGLLVYFLAVFPAIEALGWVPGENWWPVNVFLGLLYSTFLFAGLCGVIAIIQKVRKADSLIWWLALLVNLGATVIFYLFVRFWVWFDTP